MILFKRRILNHLKGSLNASLIWAGYLWYMLYNYVFYLYGAVFNVFFLRKNPWGVVLAAMILLKGVLYPLVLIIGGLLAFIRVGSWDIFIPLYAVLWLLCLHFYRLLFRASGGKQHHPTGQTGH